MEGLLEWNKASNKNELLDVYKEFNNTLCCSCDEKSNWRLVSVEVQRTTD
jgi:hypothetical protein